MDSQLAGRQRRWHVTTPRRALLWAAGTAAVLFCMATAPSRAPAEDWPTYRHDVARSGISAEALRPPLAPVWEFHARHAPQPAWGDPKPEPVEKILELRRIHFDDVFQPVAAGGAVLFGSSADGKVACLDAATGKVRWTQPTGGPVRLAPAVAGGRVYVGSDDGHAYCFAAQDGKELWRFRAAPEDRRVLGHGRMISPWPLRSGVLVEGPAAYVTAGVFPAEGVFVYALDAETGRELWRNDACGEEPRSRISPQGYLLASDSTLYVPMGRTSPAAFARSDGRLLHEAFFGKNVGGTYALLAGGDVYTGTEEMAGYRADARDRFAAFPGRKMVVTADSAYLATGTELLAMDRAEGKTPSKTPRWKTESRCAFELILAGGVLFAGGDGRVEAVDAASGEKLWTGSVEGAAKGLAVANGRLFVSTDRGIIYCFTPGASDTSGGPAVVTKRAVPDPPADSPNAKGFRQAARDILEQTGIRRGYCLVLGVETGEMICELAKGSELHVYGVANSAEIAAGARRRLEAAGVRGVRASVELWPANEHGSFDKLPYPDYCANLVVSETATLYGGYPVASNEIGRVLKPMGGVAVLAPSPVDRKPDGSKRSLADRVGLSDEEVSGLDAGGTWHYVRRGALPGAGTWTHLYANPGNTACGDDQRVRAPLEVLWFGRPGPAKMFNRHARAAGPLSIDGRMFVQGENVVIAYDAYNGLELWRREIPGAARLVVSHDSGNLALNHEGLFVAVGAECLRLDPATGKTLNTYKMPAAGGEEPRRWGYVACAGGLVYGSSSAQRFASDVVFAVDAKSGEQRWAYQGRHVPHNSIAVADGTLYLIDALDEPQEREQVIQRRRAEIEKLPEPERAEALTALQKADVRRVVALDAATGAVRWQKALDLTGCGGYHAGSPNSKASIALMAQDGVLVIFGAYLDGHYWQQFFAGKFGSRRIVALAAADGEPLWSKHLGFRVRPLIVGDTLHAEPWAFDLKTGEPRMRTNPITGAGEPWQFARPGHHCGCVAASPQCLFFRSWNLGYYDLVRDQGTMHFGAQRPGCWINFIPAGGLLLMPEASAGCMCAFPNMCTVVFRPSERQKAWGVFSAEGPATPAKHLALNLGAPGDRRDEQGTLWLGFPRPGGSLVMPLRAHVSFGPGGRFVRENSVYTPVVGTERPWLFGSAADGVRKIELPLRGSADGEALYLVRLVFAEPENDRPGRRVFDVRIQGNLAEEGVDPLAAGGGKGRAAVREFRDVRVEDSLTVEFLAKSDASTPAGRPILYAIEAVEQQVLTLGCSAPSFTTSSIMAPEPQQLVLGNRREAAFEGRLQLSAPAGLRVSPQEAEIKLPVGGQTSLPIEVGVSDAELAAGQYQIELRLIDAARKVELERSLPVEHLGRRGRVVLRPSADTYTHRKGGDRDQSKSPVLLVDGGSRTMADADHCLAFVQFKLEVPGKPVAAKLRLFNAGNPTGDAGRVCAVEGAWDGGPLTYATRPKLGKAVAELGPLSERQTVERPLDLDLAGLEVLNLALDPTSCDGVDFFSSEGERPPELIVDYEQ